MAAGLQRFTGSQDRSADLRGAMENGSGPSDDGWGWLYRAFDRLAPPGSSLRRALCAYYLPTPLENAGDGRLFRWLGVPRFGGFLPTGGVTVRRVTGARMAPYTLAGTSRRAARSFFYRACVFESLHLPFLVAMLLLAVQRASVGRIDWAVQESAINLVVNVYPILHHRNTRRRILSLLARRFDHGRQTESRGRPTVDAKPIDGRHPERTHGSRP